MTAVWSDSEVTGMTREQELGTFAQCLESALTWIQAVHERLEAVDNTDGPKAALQARLRETEAIRSSEHDGWMKVNMALVAAEVLLQNSDEEIKRKTRARLKEVKALWEETSMYITHCHSRIEWVWLHWTEYLRAQEEFERWLLMALQALDPHPELQPGVREKVRHLEWYRVLLDDVRARGASLDRLLEEASDLHGCTRDTSVGPRAQERLREAYAQIRDKAEDRVSLLQKIAEDHRVFDASMHRFWTWLDSMSIKISHYCDPESVPESTLRSPRAKGAPENTLQELCETMDREEATLQHLEGTAESVKANTSPLGAGKITSETERLRLAWEELRQRLRLEEERKRAPLRGGEEQPSSCEELQAEASSLLLRLHRLEQELGPEGRERAEEENELLWRKYRDLQRAMAAEEPAVEQLKARLTELFRVPQGPRPGSEHVLAVVKQYQGLKGRAFRLWTQRDAALQRFLSDPLEGFTKWTQLVAEVLDASDEVTDSAHMTLLVESMKKLLEDSQRLQGRLEELQTKGSLLADVFGPQRAETLGAELSTAVLERERKHGQLLQRRAHLKDLLSRSKDFGERHDSVLKWLVLRRERLISTDELQPDVPAKKALTAQLMVILKDIEEHEPDLTALRALVPPIPADQHKLSHLCTEWKELQETVKGRLQDSERNAEDHQRFQEKLLAVERQLREAKSRLEPLCSSRLPKANDQKAERVLGEVPEMEEGLQRVEAWSQRVLARTSEDGKGKILDDLQRLRDIWTSLHKLSMELPRVLHGDGVTVSDSRVTENEGEGVGQLKTSRESWVGEGAEAFTKNKSKQSTEDHSGRSNQGQKLLACQEEDSVRPGVGRRVRAAVETMGFGNCARSEKGFGNDAEDITCEQMDRPVGRTGAGEEGGFKTEIDGKGFHQQDLKAGRGFEAVDESMCLEQGLKFKEQSKFGDEGGVSAVGKGLELDVRTEREPLVGSEEARVGWSARGENAAEDENVGLRKGFRGLSMGGQDGTLGNAVRSGEMDLGKGVRAVTVSGRRYNELGSGLDQGKRPGWSLDPGANIGEGRAEQAFSQQDASVSQVSAGVHQVDLGSRHSESPVRKRRVGTEQQSGGTQIINRGHSVKVRGKTIEDKSLPQESSGTRVSHHTQEEFEAWLQAQNAKLNIILSQKGKLTDKELKLREKELEELRSHMGWGQSYLQGLLIAQGRAEDPCLEELRYRWVLYKSKLQDTGGLRTHLGDEDSTSLQEETLRNGQKSSGLLQRACCVALPLQLLLLSLLLLAFFLPLTEEGSSCSLVNNFARSFRLMLHYKGPPPT